MAPRERLLALELSTVSEAIPAYTTTLSQDVTCRLNPQTLHLRRHVSCFTHRCHSLTDQSGCRLYREIDLRTSAAPTGSSSCSPMSGVIPWRAAPAKRGCVSNVDELRTMDAWIGRPHRLRNLSWRRCGPSRCSAAAMGARAVACCDGGPNWTQYTHPIGGN